MKKHFCIGLVLALATTAGAVQIDLVTIGNPGNANDDTGYGAVDYAYQIGQYEVTAGQYTEFLSDVAASDPYGLWNADMLTDDGGCQIERFGPSGGYTYSVAGTHVDRPVTRVSVGDAYRFCNWMQTGGTEDGSYTLNGVTSNADLLGVTRNAGTGWVLPSENEWYKAAYYDAAATAYYDYPTGTDTCPDNVVIDPDPGNNANYRGSNHLYGTTVVGEFENSQSPYGTYDQAGNVWEWQEAVVSSQFRVRGSAWDSAADYMKEDSPLSGPSDDYPNVAFRVGFIPEPATLSMLAIGGIGVLLRRKR